MVGNDVWIADEVMVLGGAKIGDGCVIGARALLPPRAILAPYGVYVGNPARLVRYRFHEEVIEKLLRLRWWDRPTSWIKEHAVAFAVDLNADHSRALETLDSLLETAPAIL